MAESRVDVCLATQLFYPAYAGPAVRFRGYAAGLRDRGVRLSVLTIAPESDGFSQQSHQGTRSSPVFRVEGGVVHTGPPVDDIPVHWIEVEDGASPTTTFNRALLRLCRTPAVRPDVVQLLNLSPLAAPWLFRIDVPLVYTRTMMYQEPTNWWKRFLLPIYWRQPYRFLDCSVVSSSVMKENLRGIGVKGRIEVIPNGTDVKAFHPASAEEKRRLRRQLGLEEEELVVLFVGSLSPRKGVDLLLEAWEEIDDRYDGVRLLLVGPRHGEIRPSDSASRDVRRVDMLLDRVGRRSSVTEVGKVDDVADYYLMSDIFVFPSRKEGMPNVVPEAYACGLPVILTPFLGLPDEFGTPGEEYELADPTPEALARTIHRLIRDPQRREELGVRAREIAESQHAMEKSLDRYAELYRRLS